ncbi:MULTISPECIES: nucleotidyl transferase AbiEii/AbiGii toxin family protein [unclassified Mesorhizobium]|uniref:nucleotidyl transferase AbiEii/AbiGii toxin family protein n=1 Tax=unclassified Mesorhizobium TaxID=325217 RepID=UPI00112CBE73|nr:MULTISPECIES: nucleotidyl transferase AbiEii/AbiGii toxin family protein [unclassified Mesorhizobium]TPJ49535.1 nucleotidyl transferase AbiEii/AbiGii toxin family protein [Mesorhizobium sp. B2-6-6]MCA0000712.1 nucleotidyl transferase AbiEii/AbiGii toxin family protein [Mesorhizobium sp. B264B2A]MCA0007193.1 nucleotidyl transferase AbiEii/AbiGii toxin family protein [Mesorhizobium sp. B264B1B]MCA0020483.1 nucleotidyl transferase AbiEii/AbiGii toxin family protein [Mesorhizobium sp. B264B1A]T
MAHELRNVGASVRARLLDRAREERADFQLLLTRYALERLLYRLSISTERERFLLKGAMLFAAWLDNPFRPTRDLDLLGSGDAGVATMVECFRAICSTPVEDDGVEFDVAGLTAEPIRNDAEYAGVRVRTAATIAGARVPIQVDVGFGDVVTPAPVELEYPTLLDSPPPRLRAYPPETVVAEKFEALASLGVANSRMKDFYDLWMIARTFNFEGSVLSSAIRRTFERRQTAWPTEIPTGLSVAFATAKSGQWRAFLTRERMVAAPDDFATIIDGLRVFLAPLLTEGPHTGRWPPGGPWTE